MKKAILKTKIFIFKLYSKIWCLFHKPPKVLGTDDTIYEILTYKKSISRYGDGEFSLIFGQSLPFQEYSNEMAIKLKQILGSNLTGHVVAIPNVFGSLNEFSDKSKSWWSDYLLSHRKKIYNILDMKKVYYDAQMTRIYINRKNKENSKIRFENIKKIWENKKILIVEGEYSRFGIGNDIFLNCKDVKRLLIPAKNAFSKYSEILCQIDEVCNNNDFELILLAAGPTATCLAYDLHLKGYWAIDIGNLDMEYEWMNLGCTEQVAIKGKYTHEARNGDKNISEINDSRYINQIISKVL